MNDAYRRNFMPGLTMAYHFSDSLAIGLSGFFGVPYDTDLADQLQTKRPNRVSQGGFSDVSLITSAELIYTPLYGKVAVVQRLIVDYDMHVLLGGGLSMVGGGTELDKAAPTVVVGVGFRIFVNRWMATTIQVRDYLYSSALNSVVDQDVEGNAQAAADANFKNNFVFMLGYSFMFPRIPKISD
jgi:outer membrane beta-barrel protein